MRHSKLLATGHHPNGNKPRFELHVSGLSGHHTLALWSLLGDWDTVLPALLRDHNQHVAGEAKHTTELFMLFL